MAADSTHTASIKLSARRNGIEEMSWTANGAERNYIDSGKILGDARIKYSVNGKEYLVSTADLHPALVNDRPDNIALRFELPGGVIIDEEFLQLNSEVLWMVTIKNTASQKLEIKDLSFPVPLAKFNHHLPVQKNLCSHNAIMGHASYLYWVPYEGYGQVLLMTMMNNTSLEFNIGGWDNTDEIFIHSSTSVDRVKDSWRVPSTSALVKAGKRVQYGFKFQTVQRLEELRSRLYAEGCLDVLVAPGMTVPNDLSAFCLLRATDNIKALSAEYPNETTIQYIGPRKDNYRLYKISFSKPGENLITVRYGNNRKAYLNFFSTEPLEVLIKKRSGFIASQQQIRDSSKWYNGLYSIWDMEQAKLLNPDDRGPLPEFVVGGSDDPSNCKPLLIAEKNAVYPNKEEIASLEYYEKNFVWGKLQRTGDEYPYPYGIYGSENWYQNRSGKIAGYNSGGVGKERMWRTFDYVTHVAIYFNLYKIARDYPEQVSYLDAKGYLERAYRTAIAFFKVPYNIEMGPMWAFHGWTDWAYKQGNFHERYIIELIDALKENGEMEKANLLRREWEKKVKYFIYDDPWPFGSEMLVDRTAFESSYYIAEYAREHILEPQEKLWYDKNKKLWYSHLHLSDSATNALMQKQLISNLALRGTIEPAFNLLGAAWAGTNYGLDYMSQMGGVAILDYALKFADEPCRLINVGYNSLLSSWALMNTGNEKNGFGYWYPNKKNDGAIGWIFAPRQHGATYFDNIPANRWVWKYDGEIDHGIVGAIHGSRSIVANDPLFGWIGYGCDVLPGKTGRLSVIPKDGVRRRLSFYTDTLRVSLELLKDGFARDASVVISKNLDFVSFSIENREDNMHDCMMSLKDFPAGTYDVMVSRKAFFNFTASGSSNQSIKIPVGWKSENITIIKRQKL